MWFNPTELLTDPQPALISGISRISSRSISENANNEHLISKLAELATTPVPENHLHNKITSMLSGFIIKDEKMEPYPPANYANSANYDPFDDRRYCRECKNLSSKRCQVQEFKPVDNIPRRCVDFAERCQK